MQITPYGRVDAQFDMLSKLGKVTPKQRKAMPVPRDPGPRTLQSEPNQQGVEEDTNTGSALSPIGQEAASEPQSTSRRPAGAEQTQSPRQENQAPQNPGQESPLLSPRQNKSETVLESAAAKDPGSATNFGPQVQTAVPLAQAGVSALPGLTGQIALSKAGQIGKVSNGSPVSPALGKSRERPAQQAPKAIQKPSYAPASEKVLELAREQRDSIFRSIALSLSETGGKAHFRLEPGELGSLGIQLELKGEKLRLHVRVEREELAAVMREDLSKLQTQLESRGLVVQEIDVQTSSRQEQQQAALSFSNKHRSPPSGGETGTNDASEDADTGLLGRNIGLQLGSGIDFLA
ncbi:MAG: hypothetical protein CSA62_09515 [Planctomycetota bacterium]|nr:MAG: hypothetical protein CSA62_09515 [Planctomycetota bacterium]